MREVLELIQLAQNGDHQAIEDLIARYEPLINKYSRDQGEINEDCKQQLIIEFILAIRRFDLNRYK
ncbi:helix-turn-helix domain-containing protein [Paenibacillus sp. 11B]|uniref:helix-turn-helix domain-containing protein n=1 Tax=unclassified Paenibacillus TaxID=185978 RepID=UPI002650315A|nr:helix-turn-helix domain-containing protein [Paenibacillus sp. 11B]MDN8588170.1 helix-turn-helix domain-containing protein [Paenibacillus sp. 11B]